MKVAQHIYGRKKEEGFSTLAYTTSLTQGELEILENNCIYELPTSIIYDENIGKPVKYIFSKLSEDSVILGKGVFTGTDELNRVGNYIFHNFIFQIKDIITSGINPITLFTVLDNQSMFLKSSPTTEVLDYLDLDLEKYQREYNPNLSKAIFGNVEFHSILLYRCYNLSSIEEPIIIEYSQERELFDFLYHLFSILPFEIWRDLSFNTLWYKDKKFVNRGIKKGFPLPSTNYSIRIDLVEESYDSNLAITNNSIYEYAKFAAKKALSDKSGLKTLYTLQNLLKASEGMKFIEVYKSALHDIKKIVYDQNKEFIIRNVSQGNIELYSILEPADRSIVFGTKNFIDRFLNQHNESLAGDFVDWSLSLASIDHKIGMYSVYIGNLWLLNILMNKIPGDKMSANRNIEIMMGLIDALGKIASEKKDYNEAIEERLLESLYEVLGNKTNTDTSQVIKSLKKLPSSKTPKILLLRALIRYQLGDNAELVSFLKEEKYKQIILDLASGGIRAITWDKHKNNIEQVDSKLSWWR